MTDMLGFVILAWMVASILGLFFAWSEWGEQIRGSVNPWRAGALSVALFTVTLQAVLFVSIWFDLRHRGSFFQRCLVADFVLLVIALPCIFAWKGRARWWLVVSSVGFGVGSFCSAIAASAY
jgi:hypothetical protein